MLPSSTETPPPESPTAPIPAYSDPHPPARLGLLKGRLRLKVALVAGVLAGASWIIWSAKELSQASTVERLPSQVLSVATTSLDPVSSYVVKGAYTGQVVARRTSSLGFDRGGLVSQVWVEDGEQVSPGQLLAELDIQALQTQRQQLLAQRNQALAQLKELEIGPRAETVMAAQARVEEIQGQQQLAATRLASRQRLYQEGALAQENLNEALTQKDTFTAQLRAAQSSLDELVTGTRPEQISVQQAQVQQIEAQLATLDVNLEQSRLVAPFAGEIAAREVSEGSAVNPGQSILRLVEQDGLEARVGVPADILDQFVVGTPKSVRINNRSYTATVSAVLPELTMSTRTATVVLVFESTADLIVGQTVQLEISQSLPAQDTYWVPTSALMPGAKGLWSVYTLAEAPPEAASAAASESPPENTDNAARQVEQASVEVVYTESERSLVRGTLSVGDQVITAGPQRVAPGQWVRQATP